MKKITVFVFVLLAWVTSAYAFDEITETYIRGIPWGASVKDVQKMEKNKLEQMPLLHPKSRHFTLKSAPVNIKGSRIRFLMGNLSSFRTAL